MAKDYQLRPYNQPVELHIDYEKELNPQQLAAVTAPPGPALVIAGAGAGKTRTLIYRVAFLLEQGIPPERILLLTFTNKAAREMMSRVADLLGRDLPALWGGTFHSMGHRLLRRHAEEIGYRPDFTIMDREDAQHLISACLAESKFDTTAVRFPKAEVISDMISLSINTQKPLRTVIEERYNHFAMLTGALEEIRRRYIERKRSANVMDFDDLLELWLKLLQDKPEIRERYQRQFQFLLVDEYQDTNRLQSEVVDQLAALHHNIMAVGDDSQSIYSWRGAHFQNILEFPQRYPKTVIYKIETNYRSTPEILQVANAAIAQNVRQYEKVLTHVRSNGPKPVMIVCEDSRMQAAFVAQRMLELREEGMALEDMAVLYRAHFHALDLQLELTRHNIPFSITSGIRFFEQAHVKDVVCFLRMVANPRDEIAFKRIVQLLPGIGGKAAEKLWQQFRSLPESPGMPSPEHSTPNESAPPGGPKPEPQSTGPSDNQPGENASSSPEKPDSDIPSRLTVCDEVVPKKARPLWPQFKETLSQLAIPPLCHEPGNMISHVLEAVYDSYLKASYSNYQSRSEDLKELARFAQPFENLNDFLAQMALLSNLDAEGQPKANSDDEKVRLSTIHQAKGLEFGVVFVIMLCDGLFPSARSLDDKDREEEERRLFYVAITRARNELYLSYPLIHSGPGYGNVTVQKPSRFLGEIPRESIEEWNLCPMSPYQSHFHP